MPIRALPMGLAGELSTIGLAEVFQNLAFNRLTGTLTITEGEKKARVCLDEGRIRAVSVDGQELDYIETARLAGAATEEMLERAAAGKRRRTLKAFLAAGGGFDEACYDAAVAARVQDEILPLFGWAHGSFRFEEGKIRERLFAREQLGCGIDLDPQGVAMEAARRHDEWSSLCAYAPSEKEVLVGTDGKFEGEIDPQAAQLLGLIDGTRTLAEVIESVRMKKYDVLTGVARLIEAGRVVTATPADLRELASRARMAGDINLAARRLEVALQLDAGDLDARRELVRLYERASRKTEAARVLARMAELLAQRGDMEAAREAYERAGVLAPDELDIMERNFRFCEARGEPLRTLRAGERLAAALVAQEMYEDAVPLFERLLMEHDQSFGLRESFAACLARMGEQGKAAQHLLLLAERVLVQGDLAAARRAYRNVLTIDPDCGEARTRIEEIDSGAAARRKSRRKRRRLLAAAVVAVALFGWQAVREGRALEALHEITIDSVVALGEKGDDRARAKVLEHYAKLCARHPFTRSASLAGDGLRTLLRREIVAIEDALERVPKARTTADIEFSLGRPERQLKRIGKLPLAGQAQTLWEQARRRIMRTIESLRGS